MDMQPQPLPLGIQTFRKIVERGLLYVDKTRFVYQLATDPSGVFFLARPRRFGKSLLISTFYELFRGNRELFEGLWIAESDYSWEPHPVIWLDLSGSNSRSASELRNFLSGLLKSNARDYGIELEEDTPTNQLRYLVQALARENEVVILIDEYDGQLVNHLTKESIFEIQEELRQFFSAIKSLDRYLHFVFITGISQFSRVGIFSGLNNLRNISDEPQFSTIVGITENELQAYFFQHIRRLATTQQLTIEEQQAQLRHWYNGYCFTVNCQRVYNPYSVMNALAIQRVKGYWFESGTPTFLLTLIRAQQFEPVAFEEMFLPAEAFSIYDVEHLSIIPLLFQTGYITIKAYDPVSGIYTLGFPNYEVESAFSYHLVEAFTTLSYTGTVSSLYRLVNHLRKGEIGRFFETLNLFFVQVPYDLHIKLERYYQSLFYLIFKLIGLQIQAEVKMHTGRIDVVIDLPDAVYIFEFKLDGSADSALAQIREKGYADRFRPNSRPIHLIGAKFDSEAKQTNDWQIETIQAE